MYVRAGDLAEAFALLGEAPGALPLAGGQALIKQLRSREAAPARVVDISRIDALRYVRVAGDRLEVGAGTTLATLAADALVARHCPALAAAAGRVGDVQVRGRATAGGNLFNGPASDIGTVLLAARGELVIANGGGEAAIGAAAFFGREAAACPPGSLVTGLRFGIGVSSAYEKLSRRAADPAMANAAVFVWSAPANEITVALGAVHRVVASCDEAAAAFRGSGDPDAAHDALVRWAATLEPPDTPHASAQYRRMVAPALARRVLQAALSAGDRA